MEARNTRRMGLAALVVAAGIGVGWLLRDAAAPRDASSESSAANELDEGAADDRVPAPEVEVVVSVFDARGYTVRDVGVWLEGQDKRTLWSAWTDAEGRCTLRAPANTALATIRVRASDGRETRADFDPRASHAQLVIERTTRSENATVLRGVATIDGAPAGAGFDVLVADARAREEWTVERAARALNGARVEGMFTAKTDANGAFALLLDGASVDYRVCCGGRGWINAAGFESAHPGFEVKLRLVHVYGAVLRMVDGDGPAAASSGPPVLGGRPPIERFERGSALRLDDVALLLAGARPEELEAPPSSRRVLVALPHERPKIGPNSTRVELFGYEPRNVTFDATPLASGLQDVLVPMTPLDPERASGAFGGVRVRAIDASPELLAAFEPSGLRGELFLRPAGAEPWRFRCSLSPHRESALEYVPCGEYRAHFRSAYLGAVEAAQPLIVRPGWSELEISLRDLGGARLVFTNLAKTSSFDPLVAKLEGVLDRAPIAEHARVSTDLKLVASPHLLAPLAAGAYELVHERVAGGGSAGRVSFRVEPGAIATVEFDLDP